MALIKHPLVCRKGGKGSGGISNLVSYRVLIYCYYHPPAHILLFVPFSLSYQSYIPANLFEVPKDL